MATLLVQPSSSLGDGSLRGIATTNQVDADYFLFVTCSYAVTCPTESIIAPGKFQLILPCQHGLVDLADVLSVFRGVDHESLSSVVLRNYLELGNFFVGDQSGHASLYYCVIGDTHHLPQSLAWCLDCLRCLKPHFFFSRSNPHHAILLAQCLKRSFGLEIEYSAAPDYLLFQPQPVSADHHEGDRQDAIFCISNLQNQLGRRRLIRKLLIAPNLLSATQFFEFLSESGFRDLLYTSRCLLIPSINGQVSPQIFYAISHGCLPVVDCCRALQTSNYHRELLPMLALLDQVVATSRFPESCASFADFISLSLRLKTTAPSEVSFVQRYLSSHPFFRQLFSLGLPVDLCSSFQSCSRVDGFEDLSSQLVFSHLDQIKLLSLREPFLRHQHSLDQASQALIEMVCNDELQASVALSLQVISESRRWLYYE